MHLATKLGSVALGALLLGNAIRAAEHDAGEPITLETAVTPAANQADEPLAAVFSAAKARDFLDHSSLAWQKTHKCLTCHTNYLYLLSRPSFNSTDPAPRAVREFVEQLVSERWPQQGPRWDAEVVMTALVLAAGDAATTGQLHPLSRQALDRIWTVQKEDGGFEWLKCNWPPMESDDEYGAPMAALAVSLAPENYAETPAAQRGIAQLRNYLQATPPPMLHHRAMLLWADTYRPGWLSAEDRRKTLDELVSLQHDDGGWSVAALGKWDREDDSPQDLDTSDGYATGLVVLLARRAGIPADDVRLVRGVAWLKAHQRASGRWFTRSLYKDSRHFLSHAGTSMAVMALQACDELQ